MSALTRIQTGLHDRLQQPPGPFRPEFWRSPLRGPWLTSVLGSLLLPLIVIIALTGLISQDAYHPELRGNAIIDKRYVVPLAQVESLVQVVPPICTVIANVFFRIEVAACTAAVVSL